MVVDQKATALGVLINLEALIAVLVNKGVLTDKELCLEKALVCEAVEPYVEPLGYEKQALINFMAQNNEDLLGLEGFDNWKEVVKKDPEQSAEE